MDILILDASYFTSLLYSFFLVARILDLIIEIIRK